MAFPLRLKSLFLIGSFSTPLFANWDPMTCGFEKLAVAPEEANRVRIELPLKVTHVALDRFLVDAVEGMVSVPQILKIERMLDNQGDGLGLTPTLADCPKGQSEPRLKQWTSRVDEYFAGAEFNPQRHAEVRALFLDYVNRPPRGYLPGYEEGPRSHHDTPESYYASPYGEKEHDVAVRTLQNSMGFLEVVDSSKDDRQRLERAMKVRSGYFMMKVLQWGHAQVTASPN